MADDLRDRIAKGLRSAVEAAGGAKEIGVALWPGKDIEDAECRVSDCINPSRREKFSLDEVVYILAKAREADCHDAMHALAKACGYEAPRPIDESISNLDLGDSAAVVPVLLKGMLDILRDIRSDGSEMRETLGRFAEAYAPKRG